MKLDTFESLCNKINDECDNESSGWFQGYISALCNNGIINEHEFDALLNQIINK